MNRTISISLEQAKEWAHGDNEALKELALTAFNTAELGLITFDGCVAELTTADVIQAGNLSTLNTKLLAVASTLNRIFKGDGINAFFIAGKNLYRSRNPYKGFNILNHQSVRYLGIVYFNTLEAAKIAIDLLYDDLEGYESI